MNIIYINNKTMTILIHKFGNCKYETHKMMMSDHRTMNKVEKGEYENLHPHLNPPPSRGRKEKGPLNPLSSSEGKEKGKLSSSFLEKKERDSFSSSDFREGKKKGSLPPNAGEGQDGGDIHRARELRKRLTNAEKKLWSHIRLRQITGHKFRRQQPIGKYIVDFVCLEKKLVVEVDGRQHSEQSSYDEERTVWLESQGYRVLRFWNNEVLKEIEVVLDVIVGMLKQDDYQT
ncbi:MAG: endonuclease domain-containing protein [Thermodesulfobacteriota bacterium]